jgi:hypothetical protein
VFPLNIWHRTIRFNLFAMGLLIALSFLLTGCGISDALNNLTGQVGNSTTKTVNILDDAINQLAKNSADWQTILQETRDKLTEAAQSTVRTEVSQTLDRAVATTSTEFRCDVDFLRTRVREDLIAIKSKFLGQQAPPLQPSLCNVIPSAIDLNLDQSRRNIIEYYGYNFDTTPNLQLVLENADGSTRDVTSNLTKPTYYHMTVNLGGAGVPLDGNSSKFHLRWQEQELSTLSVLQPTTPVCESKSIDPQPVKLTVVPEHTGGDTNFGGNIDVNASIATDRWFAPTGVGVSAVINIKLRENGGDHTAASTFQLVNLYTPDPGWDVEQLTLGQKTTDFHYTHTDTPSNIDSFDTGGQGPVQHLDFEGLNSGDGGAGSKSKVTITFNPLRMVVTQHGNCVSPIVVNLAGKNGNLSTNTQTRLKPLLNRIPANVNQILPTPEP